MALAPKQQRFVAEYLIDLNGTQAAIRAGYSPRTANQQADQMLNQPAILAAVQAGQAAQLARADLKKERVLEELRRLAFGDVRDLFDKGGNLRPLHTLTPEQSACIASLEVIQRNLTAGDGHVDTIHKLKVWDKTKALELLAKHFGLLTDRVEHGGEIVIRHELAD